ncbi:SDR family oxidoreductase [Naasia lichenicola]|uniref:SDR family oxidoreductase n=1 Tax=Naasia lichenicola TaxID=2565933 RepID=A0A4S4FST9_9MICO|nr:SDR family oxidoreductase [Naasia lichenicola]THG33378.1 SDR family oxidoreductase [Naasia lichenicola]
MRVFVTGASGWVGAATVPHLQAAGHTVTGLARSDSSASALRAAGVEPIRGSLDDTHGLAKAAAESDGVLHLAFMHDFSDYAASGRAEHAAVTAMLEALEGSDRPFLLASGIAGLTRGRAATEQDRSPARGPESPRGGSENLALDYAERGVRTVSLRFAPTVHGEGDHGFMATLAGIARETGVAGYIGDGSNRWAAAARDDIGRMNALALESARPGTAMHGVAEEGIPTREIAEALGRALGVPTRSIPAQDAEAHFGWMSRFLGGDLVASSSQTQRLLGWKPNGPSLFGDIEAGFYTP